MITGATLFSGGELVGVGMRAAGITHLWGIEWDDKIASVARTNGFNTITADVMAVDPRTLQAPDIFHASPVCTRASIANANAEEQQIDIDAGEKTSEFIEVLRPKVVTLENVYQYRNFEAFKIICRKLESLGYMYDWRNVNAADFGVPQSRRRLILRAIHGGLLPHFPKKEKHTGWLSAIADIVHTLPDSEFADWQSKRLPKEIKESSIWTDQTGTDSDKGRKTELNRAPKNNPSPTIVGNKRSIDNMRAVILNQNASERGDYAREHNRPAYTVTAEGSKGRTRAFIIPGDNSGNDVLREESEPSFTIGSVNRVGNIPRAFVIDGQSSSKEVGLVIRNDDQPMNTITGTAYKGMEKANTEGGRVVKMTPRALARFQTLPDSYQLPDSTSLACKIIGNGVPCLLYEKIIRDLIICAFPDRYPLDYLQPVI